MTPRLTIHKAGEGYIGRLVVSDEFLKGRPNLILQDASSVQTVFILDRSGSMGRNVNRMARIVIPAVARRYFKLQSDDTYTLITFDSITETTVSKVCEFEKSNMQSRGCTNMAPVFSHLRTALNCIPNVRIVAISDGEVHDTRETLGAASAVAPALKGGMLISATAIRLFTSGSQPDTRALASILQLNTATTGSLVDVLSSQTNEEIITQIGAAINPSSTGPLFELTADVPCFLQVPWAKATQEIYLNDLSATKPKTVWLESKPIYPTLDGEPVDLYHGDQVTHETLHVLLADKIKYCVDQLRLLKVMNSESSKEELVRIVTYFQDLEASLPPPQELSGLLEDRSLAGRSKYIKASIFRRLKSVTMTMQSIANDQRIAKLNLAQQAEYLRQTGDSASRNARALARRADDSGIDFDATMRAEILSMAAHMADLGQVDDSQHAVSFYSSATTLEGIQYIVELAKDPETLQNLTAADMLRLFNIVGIPAVAPVGDYPDPMTDRIEKLLYGSYVSVADITMTLHQGGTLTAPGHTDQIVTAIPFFESRQVQTFLQRYARSSLEYIASIGMRRMICEVPKTYPYTICSGIWKMVEELDKHGKTEIRVQNFQHLVHTYENAVQGYFDHILPLLGESANQDPTKSFNLGYNGITNMIAPILYKIRHREKLDMPRILRALYSFETYQVIRRVVRTGGPNARREALDKLLGIDFSQDQATPLSPMFTRTEPVHCMEAVIDQECLEDYAKHLWFVPYATLLEPLFTALIDRPFSDNDNCTGPIQAVRKVEPMSDETIAKALDLPSSSITLKDFMLFNVVEGLLCTNKASRVDKETNLPKLGDLGHVGVGSKMIQEYVASRYEANYKERLKVQSEREQRILQTELVATLVSTTSLEEFEACILEGKQRGPISVQINSPNDCAGFQILHNALMNLEQTVPRRAAKLYLIYSGRPLDGPQDKKIFNGGNLYCCDWKPLQELLVACNKTPIWERLQVEMRTRGHVYRGGSEDANRHGHSNDFKSYFAFGCKTLAEYHARVDTADWCTYIQDHRECCGVAQFVAHIQAAAFSS